MRTKRHNSNLVKCIRASALIALSVLLFGIPLAHADILYTYTGGDFIEADGFTITTSDFVTATLVYASPLPASTTSTAAPISWTMTAGPFILTSAPTDFYDAGTLTGSITTDAAGDIEYWDLTAIGPFVSYLPPYHSNIITSNGIDEVDYVEEGGDGYGPSGTWTFRTIPAVSEPSSFALLGAGLAGVVMWLVWERRRRRKEADRSWPSFPQLS